MLSVRWAVVAVAFPLLVLALGTHGTSDAYFGEDEADNYYFGEDEDDMIAAEVLRSTHEDNVNYLAHGLPSEDEDASVDGAADKDASTDENGEYSSELVRPVRIPQKRASRVSVATPMAIMVTLDGALHAVDMQTGDLLWSFSTGGKTISSSAPFHGDLLFLSTLDGHGLLAYKPGVGLANIDKTTIFQSTKPFILGHQHADDRCVTGKQTKLFRVKVATGLAGAAPKEKEQCEIGGEPMLFVARTDYSISCVDGTNGEERWRYEMAEFDFSMSHSPPDMAPLPYEHGLAFVMDPGEQSTKLQAVHSESGASRWTFIAPHPLLPTTVHTITTAAELHAADLREVPMKEDGSSDERAVVNFRAHSEHPTIKIREYDKELFVLGSHRGEVFGDIQSLYDSVSTAPKQSSKQRKLVQRASTKDMVLTWKQLDQCAGLSERTEDGELADELSVLHRDCLVGNYPLQFEALAQLGPGESRLQLLGPDADLSEAHWSSMLFEAGGFRWKTVLLVAMLLGMCIIALYKYYSPTKKKKKKKNRANSRRGSHAGDQLESHRQQERAATGHEQPSLSEGSDQSEEQLAQGTVQGESRSFPGVKHGKVTRPNAQRWSLDETTRSAADGGNTLDGDLVMKPHVNAELLELLGASGEEGQELILKELQQAQSSKRSSLDISRTNSPILSASGSPRISPLMGASHPVKESRYAQEYEELEMLGKGSFGSVHRVRNRVDENDYAVKKVTMPEDKIHTVLDEVRIISRLDHPNVIRFYTSWIEDVDADNLEDFCLNDNTETKATGETWSDESSDGHERGQPSVTASTTWCWSGHGYARESFGESPGSHAGATAVEEHVTLYEASTTGKMTSSPVLTGATGAQALVNEGEVIFTDDLSESSRRSTHDAMILKHSIGGISGISSGLYVPSPTATDTKEDSSGPKEQPPAQMKVLYISMQLCQTQTVYDWLRVRNSGTAVVDRAECMSKFCQMVAGLEYVHSQNLIHRDLKPANIFISKNNVIKLGDFGLSRTLPQSLNDQEFESQQQKGEMLTSFRHDGTDMTLGVGTPTYTSPEVLAGSAPGRHAAYTAMADIFSLGIILVELYQPFSTAMERALVLSSAREGILPASFSEPDREQECDLGTRMLKRDPLLRPSAASIATALAQLDNDRGLGLRDRSISAPSLLGKESIPPSELVVRTSSHLVELPNKLAGVLQSWCNANGMPQPSPRWQSNVDGEEMVVRFTMSSGGEQDPYSKDTQLLESMYDHICATHPSLSRDDVEMI